MRQNSQRAARNREAIEQMKQALEIDPLSLEANNSLGARYYWAKQYDQAVEQLKKTIELDQNFAVPNE